MKIIVAGAGRTGTSIVSYFNQSKHDIVVVDKNLQALKDLSSQFEVQTLQGSISHPEIMEQAGGKNADVLIAVTDVDETNMVACQVAYTIFGIKKKVARIDSVNFLEPLWSKLYNEHNMPIDYIISPDVSLSETVFRMLKIPGSHEVLNLLSNSVKLIAFRCDEKSPMLKAKLMEMQRISPDLDISILFILRNGEILVPCSDDEILLNDMVYFLVKSDDVETSIRAFGMQSQTSEHIVIFGANRTSGFLFDKIYNDSVVTNLKIVEDNKDKAVCFSKKYSNSKVINGQMTNELILQEADIDDADTTIAITSQDKDNILVSLLAQSKGVPSTISLVNSRLYDNLFDNIGKNILVDRSMVIVSDIIKAIRKPKLSFGYCLGKNCGEIWEIELKKEISLKELSKLKHSKIGAIYRKEAVLFNLPNDKFEVGDKIVLFAGFDEIDKLEHIFA